MNFDLFMLQESIGDKNSLLVGANGACHLDLVGMQLVTKESTRGDVGEPLREDLLYLGRPDILEGGPYLSSAAHMAISCDSFEEARALASRLSSNGAGEVLFTWLPGDLAALANSVNYLMAELDIWDQQMIEAAVQTHDPLKVLDIGVKRIGNPVAIFDADSALIGYSGDLPANYSETIWGEVLDKGRSPIYLIDKAERRRVREWLTNESQPFRTGPIGRFRQNHLTITVFLNGHPFETLSLVDITTPFTAAKESYLMHVRDRLQQLAMGIYERTSFSDESARCLRMILEGHDVAQSFVAYHLRQRGWHPNDELRLLFCLIQTGSGSEVENRSYLAAVQDALPLAIVTEFQDAVVAVYRSQEYDPISARRVTRIINRFGEELQVIGQSSEYRGLFESPRAYRQARAAYEFAARSGKTGIMSFDDAFEGCLAYALGGQEIVRDLYHPSVVRLLDEGGEERYEKVRELYGYLLCGGNITRAAQQLHMHRNTLEYHVKSIERDFCLDFKEMDETELFRMVVSCALALNQEEAGY